MSRSGYLLGGALLLSVLLLAAMHWGWRVSPAQSSTRSETIGGGDGGGLPRAAPVDQRIDAVALERAVQDPAAARLEAFIVMRNGYLVFERYGRGVTASTRVDGGGFARVLLALAAGIAADEGVLQPTPQGFDAIALRTAIEAGTHEPYSVFLSHKLWARLNANAATLEFPAGIGAVPADCCVHARPTDWMRVAALLTDNGHFEGKQVVPAAWLARLQRPASLDSASGFGVELSAAARGAEPFATPGVYFLRGPGHWRLWLVPSLKLAVLFGAQAGEQPGAAGQTFAWDETRLPNLVIRAVSDRPVQPGDLSDLQRLVPEH
jgi:CubicO group peptidase (beta-lactamase class C family)